MDLNLARELIELVIETRDEESGTADLKLEGLSADDVNAVVAAASAGYELLEQSEDLASEAFLLGLDGQGIPQDLAKVVCAVFYEDEDEDDGGWTMDLEVVDGLHVLRLVGDVSELEPEGRTAIRDTILEPLFVEDCRLLIDLRQATFFQTDVVGLLISDVLAMRDAGGDVSVLVAANLVELAEKYRLDAFVHVESEAEAIQRLQALDPAPVGEERIRFETSGVGEVGVLAVRGALDARTAEAFEQRVQAQLSSSPRLVLDCSEVTWISSGGFALLLRLTSPSAPSTIKVAGLRGPAALVAEVMGLQSALGLYADRSTAIASFA